MAKQYFIPRNDPDRQNWLKNFSAKLPSYVNKYNITPAEVADVQNGAAYFNYVQDYRILFVDYLTKLTAYKKELIDGVAIGASSSVVPTVPTLPTAPAVVASGIFVRAIALANVIKNRANYTIADGNDLGIEGPSIVVDPEQLKPDIKIRLVAGGKPEVVWAKQRMDGIEIHVERTNGNWEMLAFDSHPNYTDNAPLPAIGTSAVWKYKAIYHHGDTQVGQWSDVVSITVTGG